MARLAGLMWSTHSREGRKTHAFIDPELLPICNPGLHDRFLWDFDDAKETPHELAERIDTTDKDGIVCRGCLRVLRSMP